MGSSVSATDRAANSAGSTGGAWGADTDPETFTAWFGRSEPLEPSAVAALLDGSGVRWWIAGGRAARVGAVDRPHEDTDVAVNIADLPDLRRQLSDWHLWELIDGGIRPLRGTADVRPDCEQLWLRRDAEHPWVADILLHRDADEWVFKKDARVRVPWERALHIVDDVPYLRPEIALLHKAHLNRAKDRADLAAAVLEAAARQWLIATLELLGHHEFARAAAAGHS